MALPFTLFAMLAGMALASAAVVATINVQQGSHRDSSTKSAIAVADAGANIARSRINRYAVILASKPCLKLGASGVLEGTTAESDGWCPAVPGTVGGGTYSYRVSPAGSKCGEKYGLCVVSTGTVGEASRRIEVAYTETPVEETKIEETVGTTESSSSPIVEGLIGLEAVEIEGSADIQVGIGTNGDVTVKDKGSRVCRDVRHGVGHKFQAPSGTWCAGYKETEQNKTMPPVSSFMPSNIETSNSDSRLVACTQTKPTKLPVNCELDSFTGNRNKSTYPWDAAHRALSIGGNDVLTVSGGDYWICSLELGGTSQLIMGAIAQVRFFFDTPEHCGLSPGATQLTIGGNNRISSSNKSVYPAFYFLGPSNVSLKGNSGTDELVVYGSETTINLTGSATYKGVMAGKKIIVSGSGHIEDDSTYKPPAEVTPVTEKTAPKTSKYVTARYYSPQFYVECAGGAAAQGSAPNASC
jgi:hypothetical protein